MDKIDLHDEFIQSLYKKIPQKKYLIDTVSEIIRIEREPVYRRLSGKVQFSIREMGLLANKLDISIDSLLHKDKRYQWFPFVLEAPLGADSIENMCDFMDFTLEQMGDIAQESAEFGCLVNSIPTEFFMHHPYLMKFMFFKWGHYFVGTDEFNDFSQWELPHRLTLLKEKMDTGYNNITDILYIWNESLIWTITGEIDYFCKMQIINTKDKENIKNDLKKMLVRLESYLKGLFRPDVIQRNVAFYVSNINIGVTGWYLSSIKKQMSYFNTNFSSSRTDETYETYVKIKEWVNSFKNISVLISDSGSLARRLFFEKQHKIIDFFLE